jgi:hypothetical protein
MKPTCTDDELIGLWQKYKSATKISKVTGISARAIHSRLIRLEGQGYVFESEDPRSPRYGQRYAEPEIESPAKLSMEIEDGVVLIGSDAHYWPGDPTTAHRAFVHFCKRLKPLAVVLNGDIFDGATVSRWARIGWDNRPTVLQELKVCTDRLAEIHAASPKAAHIWTLGNHDARFETRLAAAVPEYEGVEGFHLKERFQEWKPCWAFWVNGHTVVKHRFKNGIHATHNNAMWAGKTMVTGHLHSLRVTPFSDYNGTRWGVDTGTLADAYGAQFKDYTETNPVNWRSGFVVLTFKGGRLLWPEIVCVVEDGLVDFRGELINV